MLTTNINAPSVLCSSSSSDGSSDGSYNHRNSPQVNTPGRRRSSHNNRTTNHTNSRSNFSNCDGRKTCKLMSNLVFLGEEGDGKEEGRGEGSTASLSAASSWKRSAVTLV